MNDLNHSKVVLGFFSFILVLFGLIHLSSFSYGVISLKEMSMDINFQMEEFTSLVGGSNDSNSIILSIPESGCNLTDLKINFTSIHQKGYTQVIDGGSTIYAYIEKSVGFYALGGEFRLNSSLSVSSVEIFGFTSTSNIDQAYIQIQGYNVSTMLPNSTIYGVPTLLNISITPDWYIQNFNTPISLTPGRYYLVINASLVNDVNKRYYWKYGDISPLQSALYSSEWEITAANCHFCYKLNQEDQLFNPNEINMILELAGVEYDVMNGMSSGSGTLNIENVNYFLDQEVNLPNIYTNHSAAIFFDYYYDISINYYFLSNGNLTIIENSYNIWNIVPNISRRGYDQMVRFLFPFNWNDFVIYRDGIDNTLEWDIPEIVDYFYFMNETISDDSDWLITATSYLCDYEIDCLNDHIIQGEVLNVSMQVPEMSGIAVFKLFNSEGIEIHNETKILNSNSTTFNYATPSNIPAGIYYIYIFWQNNVDAGVQSQAIYISVNENWVSDDSLLFILIISLISIIVGGISSYLIVKTRQRRKYKEPYIPSNEVDESIKLYEYIIRNKFIDIFNLRSIIISERFSGLYIFEKAFQGAEFNPLLISGFAEAIKSFGQEVINIDSCNQILNIEYLDLNVYIVEVDIFNFILIMMKKPSNEFLLAIDNLVEEIDYRYGDKIKNFHGNIAVFEEIINLIEKYIDINLLYPFQFNSNLKYQFNSEEKEVLYKAYKIMKQSSQNHFFLSSMLSETNFDLKTEEIILNFIRKKIFIPLKT